MIQGYTERSLCATLTVCNAHCVQRSLCATLTVCNAHCVQRSLCATLTVCNAYCVQRSLCATLTVCIHVVLLWKVALTFVITSLQEGQVLKIINRLSVVPMTLDILQVSSIHNLSFVISRISNRSRTQLFIILLFCQSQCNLCSFNVSKTTVGYV